MSEARRALDQLEFEPDTPDPSSSITHPSLRSPSHSPPRRAVSNGEDPVLRVERSTQH